MPDTPSAAAPSAPAPSSPYRCAGCGRAVAIVEGAAIRACACEAGIIAEMSATTRGAGGLLTG